MGLKATGSQDIHVNDVFVPEYRTHKQSDGFNLTNPGYAVNKNDLYKIPWGQLFVRAVSTPAIGATKKMLELFIDGANNKASSDPAKLAGDTHTQTIVAEAAAKLDALETVMFRNYDVMVDQAGHQGGIPMIDRVKFRYDASLVIEKCLEVVDTLFSNAGGGAVFAGSDIQKIFLDVHTSRAHVANNPVSFSRNYGAMQLGVENTDYFV
jgi:3-hydroxy-9,10-secoandrosta-1,3,5(10)-triene-9,17-dione monooxygenase